MALDDRFPAADFDEWAESYDTSVKSAAGFPFDGYPRVLDAVIRAARPNPGMAVLDLGCGTGNLTARFAAAGCQVWAGDFSPAMLAIARAKLPGVNFFLHDLRQPLPEHLPPRFDRIVSAYVFHHFALPEKVTLLHGLSSRLEPGGWLVVADIAFQDTAARDHVRAAAGAEWEEEEYWIASHDLPALRRGGLSATFTAVSSCAGVFVIHPPGAP